MIEINKIHQIDVLDGLKQIEDNSVDIVIADPPYNIGKDFGNDSDKREISEYIKWSKNWIDQTIRIAKSTGTIFIYGFSEILAHLSVEIPINKRWLIWHYTNKAVATSNFWQRSHESIIVCWKDKPIFNKKLVREPYTETFLNNAAGKIRKGMLGRYGDGSKETTYQADPNGALPRDVLKIPALAGGAGAAERWFICKTCNNKVIHPSELKKHITHKIIKHPTQKPLKICERLLKSAMPKEKGLVLVPFAGSGSECVASKKLNMNFIGFEITADWIKIANVRLNEDEYFLEQTKKELSQSHLFG